MPRYHVEKWEERDRLHISLWDGDDEVTDWWDDDARQMFDDGFFDARNLTGSVVDYAKGVGLIGDNDDDDEDEDEGEDEADELDDPFDDADDE